MEIWKDIKGYEGLYQVSNLGNIKSLPRLVKHSKGDFKKPLKGKILKQCSNGKLNYNRVALCKEGRSKTFIVHRLVAEAFCEKDEGKEYVNHIDGNTRNNKSENLEWCTAKENTRHGLDNGLINIEKETILQNIENGEIFKFRNRTLACKFLNRGVSYISQRTSKGDYEFLGFKLIK